MKTFFNNFVQKNESLSCFILSLAITVVAILPIIFLAFSTYFEELLTITHEAAQCVAGSLVIICYVVPMYVVLFYDLKK